MVRMAHQPVEAVEARDLRVLAEVEDLEELLPAEAVALETQEAMAAPEALVVLAAQEVQQVVCRHRGQLRHQQWQLGGRTRDFWRNRPDLMAKLRSGASGDCDSRATWVLVMMPL